MISQQDIQKRIENFRIQCKKSQLRLTPQKTFIFEILASTDTHPSAEEIYAEVKALFPNMSFATVYKNLKKFVSIGVAIEIDF